MSATDKTSNKIVTLKNVSNLYSGTSLKDTIEKTSIIRTKILAPTGLINTFFTSERGKPLYYSKRGPKILGPRISVKERFHCTLKCFTYCFIRIWAKRIGWTSRIELYWWDIWDSSKDVHTVLYRTKKDSLDGQRNILDSPKNTHAVLYRTKRIDLTDKGTHGTDVYPVLYGTKTIGFTSRTEL